MPTVAQFPPAYTCSVVTAVVTSHCVRPRIITVDVRPVSDFTCALCHGTFEEGWTDEEALAEYNAAFTEEERAEPREIVCDDCYKKIMKWADRRHNR